MPKLSIWMIRAALIHLSIGFLFGTLLLLHKGILLESWTWKLLDLHIELMIFGWTMQLIMGVAYFALPRFSTYERRYGAAQLGWWSFCLFNSGLILTAFAHWCIIDSLILCGRLLMLLGVLAYVVMIWPRVKPYAVG